METSAFLILAQGASNTQEAPDGGVGAALIIVTVLLIVLAFAAIALFVTKRSKATRGGVRPARSTSARGDDGTPPPPRQGA